jgi:hypothetical protein
MFETVVPGIGGIQMKEGKDAADIHHRAVGIVKGGVMEPGKSKIEFSETFADVASCHFSCKRGSKVAAVEFADPAAGFFGLPFDIDVAHIKNSFILSVGTVPVYTILPQRRNFKFPGCKKRKNYPSIT